MNIEKQEQFQANISSQTTILADQLIDAIINRLNLNATPPAMVSISKPSEILPRITENIKQSPEEPTYISEDIIGEKPEVSENGTLIEGSISADENRIEPLNALIPLENRSTAELIQLINQSGEDFECLFNILIRRSNLIYGDKKRIIDYCIDVFPEKVINIYLSQIPLSIKDLDLLLSSYFSEGKEIILKPLLELILKPPLVEREKLAFFDIMLENANLEKYLWFIDQLQVSSDFLID